MASCLIFYGHNSSAVQVLLYWLVSRLISFVFATNLVLEVKRFFNGRLAHKYEDPGLKKPALLRFVSFNKSYK